MKTIWTYEELRALERVLIGRLERLGYPFGITMRVLVKVQLYRASVARKLYSNDQN